MTPTTWSIECDTKLWCRPVPRGSAGYPQWVERTAVGYLARDVVTAAALPALREVLGQLSVMAADLSHRGVFFAYMPEPAGGFMPVVVSVEPTQPPEQLEGRISPPESSTLYAPPVVGQLLSERLGVGERRVWIEGGESDQACVTVMYVWRTEGWDVVVVAESFDLVLMMNALDDLDEFVLGIEVDR